MTEPMQMFLISFVWLKYVVKHIYIHVIINQTTIQHVTEMVIETQNFSVTADLISTQGTDKEDEDRCQ